jgi:hypothetical protein
LTSGTGFAYQFPFGIIQIEGRYFNSLTSVMPAGKYANFYNQYISGQVSYLYILKTWKTKPNPDEAH